MKLRSLCFITAFCAMASAALAADNKKFKALDLNPSDTKTVTVLDVVAKQVNTADPAHKKATELVADFAKPDSYPRLSKQLPPNFLNPKKYSGLHFWYRSNSETSTWVSIAGPARKDGRTTDFNISLKGTTEWQEATIEFTQFKNYEYKVWDKATNSQKIFPGGETPKDDDLELINRISFVTHINSRGTSVKSHFMISDFGLIEK